LQIQKYWPQYGKWYEAVIIGSGLVDSTISPGQEVTCWTVKYKEDRTTEDLEECEIRKLVVVNQLPEFKGVVQALRRGFDYLENRLTGQCQASYSCKSELEIFRLVRIFDPSWAVSVNATTEMVNELQAIKPLAADEELLAAMCQELPSYLAAASDLQVNRADVDEFTSAVLQFWRTHGSTVPSWARAARIVFAMSPSSASCERVFSLMKNIFGDEQLRALSDYVAGSLMLKYNKRTVG